MAPSRAAPVLRVALRCIVSASLLVAPLLLLHHGVAAHPSLISCVCATTLATGAVVKTSTSASKGQAAQYVVPSCVGDAFAETGIRWYIDGPIEPTIKYWRRDAVVFSSGRSAKRLISLGYKCSRTQLYDPSEDD